MAEKIYKYIIIDTDTHDIVVKKSYREVADFINLVSEDNVISHNTVGARLSTNNHFEFNNLIIKGLIW